METLEFNGNAYPVDAQGFLKNRLTWNQDLGKHMAALDEVDLNAEHWLIIDYFREYYETYNVPPPMRMVMRVFKKEFGEENANSRYLHQLFSGSPTKMASKYGGLPKPKNCK